MLQQFQANLLVLLVEQMLVQNATATDVELPDGVELASEDDESILVTITLPRAAIEEEEEIEGLEGEEGEEGEEGAEGESSEEAVEEESSDESGE